MDEQIREGFFAKGGNIEFPKAFEKGEEIGRLIAETEIAFEVNDLSQLVQVLTLILSGSVHTEFLKMRKTV